MKELLIKLLELQNQTNDVIKEIISRESEKIKEIKKEEIDLGISIYDALKKHQKQTKQTNCKSPIEGMRLTTFNKLLSAYNQLINQGGKVTSRKLIEIAHVSNLNSILFLRWYKLHLPIKNNIEVIQ